MKISLLITTYNRAGLLDRSLERLATLTPPDELIVVDDGGADETEAVCYKWGAQGNLPAIIYVYNDNPRVSICSMARNIGVRVASHEFIATSEPELIFRSDVIAIYRELVPSYPTKVISSGLVHFAPEEFNPLDDRAALDADGPYAPGAFWPRAEGWVAPHTALYRRDWLHEVGGWDESFPQAWGWDDTDLLTRLSRSGYGQRIEPRIECVHQFHGLGADVGGANERHFFAKDFHHGGTRDLVANRDREWGMP